MTFHLRKLNLACLGLLLATACSGVRVQPTPTPTATLTATPTVTATLPPPTATPAATPTYRFDNIVPKPVSATLSDGSFYLTPGMHILVEPGNDEVKAIGEFLASRLNPATGYGVSVETASGDPRRGSILLSLSGADASLGDEGYRLTITPELVTLSANRPAGLFYGVQTLRQLLPASIEAGQLQPGPWVLQAGTIRDQPRFAWRGAMLDVARHFFSIQDVEKYLDMMALYKLNHLHLHLTDDQGWRIQIQSWPDLTTVGGSTQVGGGPGGFYTQADYTALVAYAQARYITVVPEIELPGHVSAALASYPVLDCSGVASPIPTIIHVNYSSLCLPGETSYAFIDGVIRELAALTPGPYLDIGGDEAGHTSPQDYIQFVQRVQADVAAQDKQTVGWEEIAQGKLLPGTLVQHWNLGDGYAPLALLQGNRLIMSPADRAYMDQKYDPSTPLGQALVGYIKVKTAYRWDPAAMVSGLKEEDVIGVEAPLWTETLATLAEVEYMAFPRLLGYAEIGWTPQAERNWDDYRLRLAEQGPRLTRLGVNFYASPEIPWK